MNGSTPLTDEEIEALLAWAEDSAKNDETLLNLPNQLICMKEKGYLVSALSRFSDNPDQSQGKPLK